VLTILVLVPLIMMKGRESVLFLLFLSYHLDLNFHHQS
jgi:hypothetical protein